MCNARIGGLGCVVALLLAAHAHAQNCDQTSIGLTPLNDLGTGLYLGQFQGGLYPGGLNVPPQPHRMLGRQRAFSVRPVNTAGENDPDGVFVLMSIGMSNTTQEFCTRTPQGCASFSFMGQAAANPNVNHGPLRIVDGAKGGEPAEAWDDPDDANYDRVRDQVLAPQGLSEAQVQIVWIKQANPAPSVSLPAEQADAYRLLEALGGIARAAKARYPNLRIAFLSSRIYAGYATTGLNPEPYAYEGGLAVKWLIEAQIGQLAGGEIHPIAGDLGLDVAPWLGWGPYLWADGLTPRSDGLIWECADFNTDGTHPAVGAREKVGTLLLNFMLTSPFSTPWFRADGGSCPEDLDGNGFVGLADVSILLSNFGMTGATPEQGDLDGDGMVGLSDLSQVLAMFGAPCIQPQ